MSTAITQTISQLQFKGRMMPLTVLHIQGNDLDSLQTQLIKLIKQAPKMFQFAPVVIDLSSSASATEMLGLDEICNLLKQYQIVPVGIAGGTVAEHQQAVQLGLALFPAAKNGAAATTQTSTAPTTATNDVRTPVSGSPTKVIQQPVRSGQQIYAKNADLIILSSVSHGAEVIADGNIHIYGTLHGRAIAGAQGDTSARIFCKKIEAELISIAGIYLLNEDINKRKTDMPSQIFLSAEKLLIAEL